MITRWRNIPSVRSTEPAVQPTTAATMNPKMNMKPVTRLVKTVYPPAGPNDLGSTAWETRRTPRKMTGMPMLTATRAMIMPRRFRSSMNRVVIIPHVGIHEPR